MVVEEILPIRASADLAFIEVKDATGRYGIAPGGVKDSNGVKTVASSIWMLSECFHELF
jgi:hypothetical protein